ncbi:hypothetical protein BKN49_05700 [Pseudomonas aeruginosa]|nr:hypothetical protein BKN49_05700 [Pseudomonas aeruginosa]
MNHQDEFWQLFKAGELIKLDTGKSHTLNFAATFESDAESILAVFQAASGVKLSNDQIQAAKATGLELAAMGEPSVRSLVERWSRVDGLEDFALAVKATMIPA